MEAQSGSGARGRKSSKNVGEISSKMGGNARSYVAEPDLATCDDLNARQLMSLEGFT